MLFGFGGNVPHYEVKVNYLFKIIYIRYVLPSHKHNYGSSYYDKRLITVTSVTVILGVMLGFGFTLKYRFGKEIRGNTVLNRHGIGVGDGL